jgi:hypothetical protein
MKKWLSALLLAALAAGAAAALDFDFSGEVRTGFYAEQKTNQSGTEAVSKIHNNDGDSGANEGRFRLNVNLSHENIGMRIRYQEDAWRNTATVKDSFTPEFIYAYANLFEEQLKVSAGILGESPWGSGGPELEVDIDNLMGIRTEWTPRFLPGLNLGFVLNKYDAAGHSAEYEETFADLLLDSVLGVAYNHDYFAFRFAWRLDSKEDMGFTGNEGSQFVYRVEERILSRFLPGMQISANGYYLGFHSVATEAENFDNWFYINYAPEDFTARINIRYYDDIKVEGQKLTLKPGFFYNLFGSFISVGTDFSLEMGFSNSQTYKDSWYNKWSIEPQVRLNINTNAYAALVYSYTDGYSNYKGDKETIHWVNLRAVVTF